MQANKNAIDINVLQRLNQLTEKWSFSLLIYLSIRITFSRPYTKKI